jgi:hypothetical protein
MSEQRLNSLLSAWQEQHLQERDVPAAELCREHPELAPERERRIRALRQMNNLVGQAAGSRPPEAPPSETATLPPDPAAAVPTPPRAGRPLRVCSSVR